MCIYIYIQYIFIYYIHCSRVDMHIDIGYDIQIYQMFDVHIQIYKYICMYIYIYTIIYIDMHECTSISIRPKRQACLFYPILSLKNVWNVYLYHFISITDFIYFFLVVCGLPMDPMDQWLHLPDPDLRSVRCGISCCAQCHCEVGAAESVSGHFFGGCVNGG